MLGPGDHIGDWEIISLLGEGGMGSVYRVRNRLIDVQAALKTLKPHQVDFARERFLREVRTLYQLRHDAVVRVSSFGEEPSMGILWMAMELVEGRELTETIAAGPVSPAAAITLFSKLSEGLAHAHSRRVFHRDLKPANVLVRTDGSPVLVDFGIAVEEGGTRYTSTGMVAGTPTYMAPEVFTGDAPPDPASLDVYAMGQMLMEVLTGKEAFPPTAGLSASQQMARLMGAKMQSEPLDPGDGIPGWLRRVVRTASHPQPSERYADASALLDALRNQDPAEEVRDIAAPRQAPPETEFVRQDTWGTPSVQPVPEVSAPHDSLPPTAPPVSAQPVPTPDTLRVSASYGTATVAGSAATLGCLGMAGIAAAAVGVALFLTGSPDAPVVEPPEVAVDAAVEDTTEAVAELQAPEAAPVAPEVAKPSPSQGSARPRRPPAPAPAPTPVVEPTPAPAPVVEPTPAPAPVVEPAPEPAPSVLPEPMQPAPAPAPAPRAVSPELAAAEARRDKLLANATRDWRRLAYDLSADDPSKAPMVKSFISRHGNLEVREGDIVIKVDPPEVKDAYAWLKHWGVDPP